MNQLVPIVASHAPALIAASGPRASYRFFEFFTAQIRNPHTRRAYARAAHEFFVKIQGLRDVEAKRIAKFLLVLAISEIAPGPKPGSSEATGESYAPPHMCWLSGSDQPCWVRRFVAE